MFANTSVCMNGHAYFSLEEKHPAQTPSCVCACMPVWVCMSFFNEIAMLMYNYEVFSSFIAFHHDDMTRACVCCA